MDLAVRIRKIGESAGRQERTGKRPAKKVKCQGCGKEIFSDESLREVEYVKTKRGSEWFFHTRCMVDIWERKIV